MGRLNECASPTPKPRTENCLPFLGVQAYWRFLSNRGLRPGCLALAHDTSLRCGSANVSPLSGLAFLWQNTTTLTRSIAREENRAAEGINIVSALGASFLVVFRVDWLCCGGFPTEPTRGPHSASPSETA